MIENDKGEEFFGSEAEKAAYKTMGIIEKIRVGHEGYEAAIQGIKERIKESVYSREPSNCMLLGEGGMGKTSVADMFMSMMKKEVITENDMEISTVPAFYTSFKSARSLDALTSDILEQLGDPHPMAGKVGGKASRVLKLLKQCRTVIVFIDELHDLKNLGKRESREREQFIKWIKEICNECGPLICLMGINSCDDIFDGNDEMGRRFKHKFYLRSLGPGIEGDPGHLQSFLEDVCGEIIARTSVKSFPSTDNYLNVLRVYAATAGSPDFIMTLIKNAVLRTLLNGRADVEVEDFAEVWRSGCLDSTSIVKSNPFLSTQAQIAAEIRRKNV